MKKKNELKNIKTTTLTSVIIHGANPFGKLLTKTLTDQGSKVIIVDQFNKETKPFVQELKKDKNVDFIAFEGLENLFDTISRFDYLFYLQFTIFRGEMNFTSKEFLDESANLDKCIKASLKHKAKMSIVTSLEKNKMLVEITQFEDGKPKPYSDLEIQKYSETITAEQYDKADLNVRIIRVGALIGGDFYGFGDDTVETLFQDSISKDALTIKGEGLENHYFIHSEDAVFAILRLTFDSKTNGEVVSLANEKPLTTLSLAYKLLELNTEAKRIQFENDGDQVLYKGHYVPAPFASKYGIKPKFTIEETFVSALDQLYKGSSKKWAVKKENLLNTKIKKKEGSSVLSVKTPLGNFVDKLTSPFKTKGKEKSADPNALFSMRSLTIFASLLTFLLLISYFLLTPLGNIVYGAYQAEKLLDSAYNNALDFNLGAATEDFRSLQPHVTRIKTGTENLSWVFNLTGQSEFYNNLMQLVYAMQYAAEGAELMSFSLEPLATYFEEFQPAISLGNEVPESTREYRNHLEELRNRRYQMNKATSNLHLASLKIDSLDTSAFPNRINPYITTLKQNNDKLLDKIMPFQQTVYFLPEMLGVEERQRYLILFQNPAEIRATGGWISSYALIGLEGGQIRQFEVDDIYNLDGLMRIQGKRIEPPQEMRDALQVDNWTMSLANWNPDFTETSKSATFFMREAGKASNIDGVIALDTEFLKQVLDIWGSIALSEGENVTSENLQEKMFEMHRDFEPGSTRKSDFISELLDEVLTRSLNDKSKYPQLLDAIYNSMNSKNFLVYLRNSNANRFFASQGWDGSFSKAYKSAPIPIHWNWGANKANIYLEETTNLQIRIFDERTIQYTYTLSTKNNSTVNLYPEGDYTNFMRVYIPTSSIVDEISGLNSTPMQYFENDSLVIGGWFNTPVSGTNQLIVRYTINDNEISFPLRKDGSKYILDLNIFKQPGLYPGVYKLEIQYPESWAITQDSDFNRDINRIYSQFDQKENKGYVFTWENKTGAQPQIEESNEGNGDATMNNDDVQED